MKFPRINWPLHEEDFKIPIACPKCYLMLEQDIRDRGKPEYYKELVDHVKKVHSEIKVTQTDDGSGIRYSWNTIL